MGKEVEYDEINGNGIYLLGHKGKFNNVEFPSGSVVVDMWREYQSDRNLVVQYGNTRYTR